MGLMRFAGIMPFGKQAVVLVALQLPREAGRGRRGRAEISLPLQKSRNRSRARYALPQTQAFVTEKEKRAVASRIENPSAFAEIQKRQRSAERAAELIAFQRRSSPGKSKKFFASNLEFRRNSKALP